MIENGSFENAKCPEQRIQNDTKLISPWSVVGGTGQYEISNMRSIEGIGTWSMDLNAMGPVTIQQVLKDAVPGTDYEINFYIYNNGNCDSDTLETAYIEVLGQPPLHFSSYSQYDFFSISYLLVFW